MLQYLEQQGREPVRPSLAPSTGAVNGSAAPSVVKQSLIGEQLLALDLCQVTPLQALTLLHDLQQQVRGSGKPEGTVS